MIIIGVEGQSIGEQIPLVGTPYTLNYSSMRVPGRQAGFRLNIPIIGVADPVSVMSALSEYKNRVIARIITVRLDIDNAND